MVTRQSIDDLKKLISACCQRTELLLNGDTRFPRFLNRPSRTVDQLMNFKILSLSLLLSSLLLSFFNFVVVVVWFMFVCYFLGCMYFFYVRHDHVLGGVLTVVGQTMG